MSNKSKPGFCIKSCKANMFVDKKRPVPLPSAFSICATWSWVGPCHHTQASDCMSDLGTLAACRRRSHGWKCPWPGCGVMGARRLNLSVEDFGIEHGALRHVGLLHIERAILSTSLTPLPTMLATFKTYFHASFGPGTPSRLHTCSVSAVCS